jgi:hypothetical protein
MVTTKSKLQLEYNKEVTSAALGLVYICLFWQFCKVLKDLSNSRGKCNGAWLLRNHYKRDHLTFRQSLKSATLVQSSLDCRSNVEQFNHQCFERSVKICEPLPKVVFRTLCFNIISHYVSPAYSRFFTSMSSGSHILTLLHCCYCSKVPGF